MKTIKKGDMLVSRWGWEQTNVTFYQVTKETKCFITIQQVEQVRIDTGNMTYKALPVKDGFIGKPMRRKVKYIYDAEARPLVEIEDYERAYLFDGKPVGGSSWN